jgi:PBSX family phage terminase large subunit
MELNVHVTPKQMAFLQTTADEVLYGGAAGGGKSFGQFIDTVRYAAQYTESRQIIFRRTLPELEQSIITLFQGNLPKEHFKYNASKHYGVFTDNGSIVYFGYIDKMADAYRYQGAEYDVIRFDELTHFSEEMYVYLMSRLRGTKPYPRSMKSSTNPGGLGHTWVKKRFVDPAPPETVFNPGTGSRIFIPAKAQDNIFLMKNDPQYIQRLQRLNSRERRALLYGDWDLTDGQYFDNFEREVHVVDPLFTKGNIPSDWQFYMAIDYGLDMLAALLVGVAPGNKFYVVDEFYDGNQHPDGEHKGLIVSEAAAAIKGLMAGYTVRSIFAPPDLWGRSKDTGKSIAEVFRENGVDLRQVKSSRVSGWLHLKEMLQVKTDEQGAKTADLKIFSCCRHLIRTLPAVAVDPHDPNDVATEPHELTHAPDALRYFFAGRPREKARPAPAPRYDFEFQKPKPSGGGKGGRIKPI